jgi:hypothetical protein
MSMRGGGATSWVANIMNFIIGVCGVAIVFAILGGAVFAVVHTLAYPPIWLQESRWEAMCKGPQRYDAMREAADARKPNPC